MTAQEWLKNNQLSLDIWNNKYRNGEETFEEWLDRVSGGNKEVRTLIKEKKFIFGGRILANRGLNKSGKKITLSNCYVIPAPEDNLESIFDCAAKLARTYSYGGESTALPPYAVMYSIKKLVNLYIQGVIFNC